MGGPVSVFGRRNIFSAYVMTFVFPLGLDSASRGSSGVSWACRSPLRSLRPKPRPRVNVDCAVRENEAGTVYCDDRLAVRAEGSGVDVSSVDHGLANRPVGKGVHNSVVWSSPRIGSSCHQDYRQDIGKTTFLISGQAVSPERQIRTSHVLPGAVICFAGVPPGFDKPEKAVAGLAAIEGARALEMEHRQSAV